MELRRSIFAEVTASVFGRGYSECDEAVPVHQLYTFVKAHWPPLLGTRTDILVLVNKFLKNILGFLIDFIQ